MACSSKNDDAIIIDGNNRPNKHTIIACIIASSGALLFGLDVGVSRYIEVTILCLYWHTYHMFIDLLHIMFVSTICIIYCNSYNMYLTNPPSQLHKITTLHRLPVESLPVSTYKHIWCAQTLLSLANNVNTLLYTVPSFLDKFFPDIYVEAENAEETNAYCAYDSQLLSLFTSSFFLAGMATSLPASWVVSV